MRLTTLLSLPSLLTFSLLSLLALSLLPSSVVAATVLIDSSDGEELTRGFVRLETTRGVHEYYLQEGGTIQLPREIIAEGLLLVRTGETTTYDYAATLPAGEIPLAVILHPSGFLTGDLHDENENLIVNGTVKVVCPSLAITLVTDATGRFNLFLPAEECQLSASSHGRFGGDRVAITQGDVAEASILIEERQGGRSAWARLLIVVVVILVVVATLHRAGRMKKTKTIVPAAVPAVQRPGEDREMETASERPFIAERVKDALKVKEALIVDELLLRGGRARLGEIRSAVRMPRTSLLRTLEGLEQRNILVKKTERSQIILELVK